MLPTAPGRAQSSPHLAPPATHRGPCPSSPPPATHLGPRPSSPPPACPSAPAPALPCLRPLQASRDPCPPAPVGLSWPLPPAPPCSGGAPWLRGAAAGGAGPGLRVHTHHGAGTGTGTGTGIRFGGSGARKIGQLIVRFMSNPPRISS